MDNTKININREINLEKYHALMKDFLSYYEGLTKHGSFQQQRVLIFFGNLEEIIFGEAITKSWG